MRHWLVEGEEGGGYAVMLEYQVAFMVHGMWRLGTCDG